MRLKLSVLTDHFRPLYLYVKLQISTFIKLYEMASAQKLFHITFDFHLIFDVHLLGALIICSIKFEVSVFKTALRREVCRHWNQWWQQTKMSQKQRLSQQIDLPKTPGFFAAGWIQDPSWVLCMITGWWRGASPTFCRNSLNFKRNERNCSTLIRHCIKRHFTGLCAISRCFWLLLQTAFSVQGPFGGNQEGKKTIPKS